MAVAPEPYKEQLQSKMKAIVLKQTGPAKDVLELRVDHPKPQRKPGEVLVAVIASTIAIGDVRVRQGFLPKVLTKLPQIMGCDVAGVVLEADAGGQFKAGDRVVGHVHDVLGPWGSYAEQVSVRADHLAPLPAGVSFQLAATLPVSGMTAWQALAGSMPLAGKRVLVHGGAGGVGHFAVQIAKQQGAFVAATCSARNVEFVTKVLGADLAIDYAQDQKLEEAAGGAGSYDCVVDLVGAEPDSWALLRRGGRMVAVAFEKQLPGRMGFSFLVGMMLRMLRCKLASALGLCPRYDMVMQDPRPEGGLKQLLPLVADGSIRPHVDRVVGLELAGVVAAHDDLERGGRVRGKVVLQVAPPA